MARTPIPNKLAHYRKLSRFSQADVCRLLGIASNAHLSRWESGLSMPSAKNLLKLSAIYGVLVNQLYDDLAKSLRDKMRTEVNVAIRASGRDKRKCRRRRKKPSDRAP